MTDLRWPELSYERWKPTYETLHMWLQVVGKIAVATGPPINHCWGSAMHVTSRGLSTGVLTHGDRTFAMAFDFIDHLLAITTNDGDSRTLPLAPRSVAVFHREVMDTLQAMSLPVRIWSMPVEIPSPIRFEDDTQHAAYDAGEVHAFWKALLLIERLLTAVRCGFVGKVSPANFYWGSCDLALTRFSGRLAPPREGPAFMRDAYSHEVISHGFWPGNEQTPEPVFYAYAVPEPAGFKEAGVAPARAGYNSTLSEFVLPYEAVRSASSPADALTAFVTSTYEQAATLAGWDRAALER